MKPMLSAAAAASLALCQPTAQATTQLTDNISFSGFGTLGYVRTNTNEGQYRRELQAKGADKSGSLLVDSNLGLQVTAKATDWLSATVQSLTTQRTTDEMTTRFEWAFVKATPIEGLSLRAGQMTLPNFMISDSRRIGYANTWLRPANEVYGLDLLNGGLRGVDVSYRLPIAGNSLTITALGGNSGFTGTNQPKADVHKVRGLNAVWDGDWYSVRLGRIEAMPQLDPSLAAFLPPGANLADEKYQFSGIGASVDRDNVLLQAEYVRRRSSLFNTMIGADAWYVFGGYRFGSVIPYIQRSILKPESNTGIASAQKTTAIGARWDAFSSAALKFQLERVDTKGGQGISFITPTVGFAAAPVTKPVTVVSVAIDFVF